MMKMQGCPSSVQQQDVIDVAVIKKLQSLDIDGEIKKRMTPKTNNKSIETQITNIDKQINKLIDLFQVDSIPMDVLTEKIDKLTSEKESMKALINKNQIPDIADFKQRLQILESFDWDNSDKLEQRGIIEMLVHKVIIHETYIEVILIE